MAEKRRAQEKERRVTQEKERVARILCDLPGEEAEAEEPSPRQETLPQCSSTAELDDAGKTGPEKLEATLKAGASPPLVCAWCVWYVSIPRAIIMVHSFCMSCSVI